MIWFKHFDIGDIDLKAFQPQPHYVFRCNTRSLIAQKEMLLLLARLYQSHLLAARLLTH